MKIVTPKFLKIILPLGIGVFLIWYSLSDLTPQDRIQLWKQITSANPFWVSISIIAGILSHLSRAYRWKFLLEPLGYKPRLSVSFSTIMIGYVVNMGIPRSGELLRGVSLAKYENFPSQKVIGTIITERLIDLLMLLIVVVIAFFCNTDLLINYLADQNIKPIKLLYTFLLAFSILAIGYYVLKKVEFSFLNKLKKFVLELYEGIGSVFKMQKKTPFILHTIFIWAAYIYTFYVLKNSIEVTSSLSFSAVLMAFVAGAFAFSTTNGGIGAYPIAISLVLILFDIKKTDGEALGWVIWGVQTLMNLFVAAIAFIYISFFLKKK